MLADITGLPVKLLHAAHDVNNDKMHAEVTTLGVFQLMEASLLKKRQITNNEVQNLLLSDDKSLEIQDAANQLNPREGWKDYYADRGNRQDVLYDQIFVAKGVETAPVSDSGL